MCYARPVQKLLLLLALLYAQAVSTEPRQTYSSDAPVWLHSVGKLTVPGYRMDNGQRLQQFENCSATLVAPDRVITAWHCLEYYRDLTRDILFSLPHRQQDVPRRAMRLADGGGITDDWALLKLDRPIPKVVAQPLPLQFFAAAEPGTSLSLAGYSGDEGLGASGEVLTWHADCKMQHREYARVPTDCHAYKGASGGAAVVNGQLIGVISVGDSGGLTYFIPSARFLGSIRAYLP
jgi:V8-like Glu-specific endopeptidase